MKWKREQPNITQSDIAELLGITVDGVKYHIKKLKREGIIEWVGGDKGGYWWLK